MMNKGLWVWPSDSRAQRKVLKKVAGFSHVMAAMSALVRSKEGMSNSELDDAIGNNSNWMTVWVVKQLTSLGFIEFKVDFFGGPARYQLTELGRNAFATISGQPLPPKQPAPAQAPSAVPQTAAPKA